MYADPAKEEAYRRLKVIRQRCNRKAAPQYQFYGALGVRCLLGVEEFFAWYATKPAGGGWTIGRRDHTKHYTIDNLMWQTQSEQTKERNQRHGLPVKPKRNPNYEIRRA